ncbi:hypothetical protein PF005_g15596 [Phytophthora fragariae]|uniref:Secreted protein n=1 Tax=Phytophthora fragariae TaxID=53985 RepID=A0A6A3XCS3_9STRA|nr:hypothetical protein PF005_g15596 [Phytophthora fragariae]
MSSSIAVSLSTLVALSLDVGPAVAINLPLLCSVVCAAGALPLLPPISPADLLSILSPGLHVCC